MLDKFLQCMADVHKLPIFTYFPMFMRVEKVAAISAIVVNLH